MLVAMNRFFGLQENKTSIARELRAGFTTFLTMAYILFVNPDILSKAIHLDGGNTFGQLLTATALAAAAGTFVMGVVARYPFATAPGMGLNAYFTFTVVLGQGVPWQKALGCVFLSGLLAVAIAAGGIRESVVKAFPLAIKRATAAGIGLFLAIIGLMNAGIVAAHPATFVTLGHLGAPAPRLALLGLLITTVLLALKVRGAIMIGIVATAAAAVLTGSPVFNGAPFSGFAHGVVQPPVWPKDLFLALDVGGALNMTLFTTILSLFFVDFFDTAGTLVGLAEKAGFTDKAGNLPRGSRAFVCDGMATTMGAAIGTSSTTTYVESMAGIEDGGRTGLTSVFVALFFLLSLFLWPVASAVPSCATAPALIIVGAMMIESVVGIDWSDYRESVPAFLTIVAMPFTYSIANGIAFGIISYTLIQGCSGNARKVHWIMYLLTAVLVAKYAAG